MTASLELPKAGKRELQKEARRAAIIEAALEAFTHQGFNATKLDDVAERAGIGKGTIYLYFDSKENLFEEVVRQNLFPIRDEAEKYVEEFTGSASELLASHFRNMYKAMSNPRIPPLIQMISSETLRFPTIAAFFYQEVITKSHVMMRKIIQRGVDSGEFRPEATEYPQILAAPMLLGVTWNLQFREQAPIQIEHYLERHIEIVLRGIKA